LVQGTFCYVSLNELEECETNEDRFELVSDRFDEVKQYQREVTEQEVAEYYKECKELRIDFVADDTPDGWYVDYE
jgi:CRISPR/Cas system-associated exonuclease Cas4 (RecB family)